MPLHIILNVKTEKVDSYNVFKAMSQKYSVLEVVLDLSIVAATGRFSSVNLDLLSGSFLAAAVWGGQ